MVFNMRVNTKEEFLFSIRLLDASSRKKLYFIASKMVFANILDFLAILLVSLIAMIGIRGSEAQTNLGLLGGVLSGPLSILKEKQEFSGYFLLLAAFFLLFRTIFSATLTKSLYN